MEQFGEIRSIIMNQMTPQKWAALIGLIQKEDPEIQRDVLVPYVAKHLGNSVPFSYRNIPEHYLQHPLPVAVPWFGLIKSIVQNADEDHTQLHHVLNHADMETITHLCLNPDHDYSEAQILEILKHPKCQLKGLILPSEALQNFDDVTVFTELPSLAHLEELKIAGTDFLPEIWTTFLDAPFIKNLKHLNIEESNVPIAMLIEKLGHDVRSLELGVSHFSAEHFRLFAASEKLKNLARLSLWNNDIDDDGMHALATSPHIQKLQYLNVGGNQLEDATFDSISTSKNFQHLEMLWIWSSQASSKTLQTLFASDALPALKQLNLNNNSIGVRNLKQLSQSIFAHQLERLHLYGTSMDDRLVQRLFESDNLHSLRILDITSDKLTDRTLAFLSQCGCLKNLEQINFGSARFSIDSLKQLHKNIPSLKHVEYNSDLNAQLINEGLDLWPDNKFFNDSESWDAISYKTFAELRSYCD